MDMTRPPVEEVVRRAGKTEFPDGANDVEAPLGYFRS
jgi:hypothetical protein